MIDNLCCNVLENPIGIETLYFGRDARQVLRCCNVLENPIGIETINSYDGIITYYGVATYSKTR